MSTAYKDKTAYTPYLTQLLIEKKIRKLLENEKKNLHSIIKKLNLTDKKPVQRFIKRLFDLFGSVAGLAIIAPVMILIAFAIKIDSRGSVFFKQKRIGENGKEFYMYKFRSMRVNAEKMKNELLKFNETNDLMFKMQDDPRVTKVGKFLRKFSLDELPQLFNVIKGEMSLVGPRPPVPMEVKDYEDWHYVRFAVKPGLTGLWQVSGRSDIKDFSQVVALDFKYIDNWELKLDFEIIIKTIPVVIFGKGSA